MLPLMKSALAVLLGWSVVALVACDNAVTPTPASGGSGTITLPQGGSSMTQTGGTTATGNTSSGGGTGNVGTGGTGTGGGTDTAGVPLLPTDGWVDAASNVLGIQGAIFSYGDDTSKMGMTEDFTGMNACIKGTAAKVDTACTPVAPATDCYGTFWGAAIGLNLNQPIDPVTMEGVDPPLKFDATHLTGFSFTLSGSATGEAIPTTMRFKVEDGSAEYCTWKTVGKGPNTVLFTELETKCWEHSKMTGVSSVMAKGSLVKIAWQVVTNTGGTIPFDYCVSDIRAITDGTPIMATGGTGSGGSAAVGGTTASGGTGGASGGTTAGGTGGASGGTTAGGSGGASGGSGGSGGG
jgi:hypothetical protein